MPVQLFSLVNPATSESFSFYPNWSPSERRDQSKTDSTYSNASGRKRFKTVRDLRPDLFLLRIANGIVTQVTRLGQVLSAKEH